MERLGDRLRLWLVETKGYPDRPARVRKTWIGVAMILASAIAAVVQTGNASTTKLAGIGATLGLALMVNAWQSPRAMSGEQVQRRDKGAGGFLYVLGIVGVVGFIGVVVLAILGLGGCCR